MPQADQQMLQTHPRRTQLDATLLQQCIEACYECAAACTMCADASLGEQQIQMVIRSIRLCLDCADACMATGKIVSRQTESDWALIRAQLQACVVACRECDQECQRCARQGMEHCRVCAEVCRRCEDVCNRLMQAIPAGNGARTTA